MMTLVALLQQMLLKLLVVYPSLSLLLLWTVAVDCGLLATVACCSLFALVRGMTETVKQLFNVVASSDIFCCWFGGNAENTIPMHYWQ